MIHTWVSSYLSEEIKIVSGKFEILYLHLASTMLPDWFWKLTRIQEVRTDYIGIYDGLVWSVSVDTEIEWNTELSICRVHRAIVRRGRVWTFENDDGRKLSDHRLISVGSVRKLPKRVWDGVWV